MYTNKDNEKPLIVQGDITSTNIFLTDQYLVKLGDFGSANRREDGDEARQQYRRGMNWAMYVTVNYICCGHISKSCN